jgi:hypothetical protein
MYNKTWPDLNEGEEECIKDIGGKARKKVTTRKTKT